MTFAKRLQHAREDAGLKKSELADAAGISRSSTTLFEQGHHSPNMETLVAIATTLKVTTDSLIGIDPQRQCKGRHAKLFGMIQTLDPDELSLVRQFVQMLAKHKRSTK